MLLVRSILNLAILSLLFNLILQVLAKESFTIPNKLKTFKLVSKLIEEAE